MTGRRRGGRVWMTDGEGERFDEDRWLDYQRLRREDLIEARVDKAVRERRAWLAAAAEPRETEEVEADRTSVSGAVFTGSQEGWVWSTQKGSMASGA